MDKGFFKVGMLGVLGVSVLLLASCSGNLFSGLVNQSTSVKTEQLEVAIAYASTPGDYSSIKSKAKDIINSSDATPQQKQIAIICEGKAVLGEKKVTVTDVAAQLFALTNTSSSTGALHPAGSSSEDSGNIFKLLADAMGTATTKDLREASDLFNLAQTRASANSSLALDRNTQLVRAISNLLAVDRALTTYFDINDSSVSLNIAGYTYVTSLTQLLDYNGDGSTTTRDAVTYYLAQGVDGLDRNNALPTDLRDELDKIQSSTTEVESLYNEMIISGGIYTFNSVSYAVGTDVASETRETNLQNALIAIFSDVID